MTRTVKPLCWNPSTTEHCSLGKTAHKNGQPLTSKAYSRPRLDCLDLTIAACHQVYKFKEYAINWYLTKTLCIMHENQLIHTALLVNINGIFSDFPDLPQLLTVYCLKFGPLQMSRWSLHQHEQRIPLDNCRMCKSAACNFGTWFVAKGGVVQSDVVSPTMVDLTLH